jgi:hypothetical protein
MFTNTEQIQLMRALEDRIEELEELGEKRPDEKWGFDEDIEVCRSALAKIEKLPDAKVKGGLATSEAKAEAVRENGRKGGRPIYLNGRPVDFDAAVKLMDNGLREQVHAELAPCGKQKFLDRYCELHKRRYSRDFEVN